MKLNYLLVFCKFPEGSTSKDFMEGKPISGLIIKHATAYEEAPNTEDVKSLITELETDEEFGMIGDKDFEIMMVSRDDFEQLFDQLGLPEELNEEDL